MASLIGADGLRLLSAVYGKDAPPNLRLLPQVQVLRKVWVQQFHAPAEDGTIHWREVGDLPPAGQLIISPYDIEARTGKKREHRWIG